MFLLELGSMAWSMVMTYWEWEWEWEIDSLTCMVWIIIPWIPFDSCYSIWQFSNFGSFFPPRVAMNVLSVKTMVLDWGYCSDKWHDFIFFSLSISVSFHFHFPSNCYCFRIFHNDSVECGLQRTYNLARHRLIHFNNNFLHILLKAAERWIFCPP